MPNLRSRLVPLLRSRAAWTVLAALGFLALILRRALSPEAMLTRRDAYLLQFPLRSFLAERLRHGAFPTWYPFDGLGVSYVGSAVAAPLHPLNFLVLLGAPDQALKWEVLLCYPLAALGAMRLARRLGAPRAGQLLAAVGFAASGYMLSCSENVTFLLTAAVLPWTWLAAERVARRPGPPAAALLALALLLALLGGDIQGAMIQALTSAVVVLFARPRAMRRRATALAGAGGLTALAALPMLLPVWATFRGSARDAGLPLDSALTWSLHPLRLVELAVGPLLPVGAISSASPLLDLLGGHLGATWSSTELVGAPMLALALVALLRPLPRRLRVYAVLGAGAVVLALGRWGGLYLLLWRGLPFWSAFRYPEKLMPYAVLAIAVLAGFGVRRLERADRRLVRVCVGGFVLVLAAVAWITPSRVAAWAQHGLAAADLPSAAAVSDVVLVARGRLLIAALLLGALAVMSVRGGRWMGWAATGLNMAQVLLLSTWVVGLGPRSIWATAGSPFLGAVSHALQQGVARLCWDVRGYAQPSPEFASYEAQVREADAHTLAPMLSGRWSVPNLRDYMPGGDAFFAAACGNQPPCGSPCARVGGAGLAVVDLEQADPLGRAGLVGLASADDPRSALLADAHARPFASLPAVRHVPLALARQAIFDAARDPAREALLIGPGEDLPAPGGSIVADRSDPDRVTATAELDRAGWAVFAMACARGWHAEVDGRPAAVEKADGALCAVPLPTGRHTIQLHFVPWGWPWAFLGPVAALAIALGTRFRQPKPRTPRASQPTA